MFYGFHREPHKQPIRPDQRFSLSAFIRLPSDMCLSIFSGEKRSAKSSGSLSNKLVIVFGVAFSVLLMTQVNVEQVLISLILFAVGVPVYVLFAPKKDITLLKREFLSRQAILERTYHQGEVYLANVVRHVKLRIYKSKRVMPAWKVEQD